ncbi:MAG: hypothetical protein IJF65_06760 [Clostridia bacterium]|nr:hypothetical protein [Clostridia bacterium]
MKKPFCAMILALLLLFSAAALAEEITLPDPAFYFNRGYTHPGIIVFDDYPQAEYEAYVSLLQEAYGMKIVKEEASTRYELVYLEAPGVKDSRTCVVCYTNSQDSGIEFDFGKSITLSALEVYDQQLSQPSGEIAWDDGRMIADPGDFLGYEIKVTEIQDQTNWNYGGNYFQREYEETDIYDIWQYIDALESSPYFEVCDTHEAKSASYKQIFFEYVGSDPELSAICEEGRRNPKRTCDLYIQIHYRDKEQSTFRIVTFPAFTVNSTANVNPAPNPDPNSDGKERCLFCDKGSCKKCGGKGFVYEYAAFEKDWREKKDCKSCIAGRCIHCDGDGWR